jgi:two-component system NtrC family sensor kinase
MITSMPPNRRILIIDDNEAIHRDFQHILGGSAESEVALAAAEAALFGEAQLIARERFELASAHQGQEALAMVIRSLEDDRPYAMAFVDMRMPPGWDGIETIEQLWRRDPHLQIAICSAYSDYSWEDMAKRLELRDRLLILKKPFDNIEIYQLANALTAKWQLTREAQMRMTQLESAVEERTRELRMSNEALQAQMRRREVLESQLALHRKLESIGQLAAGIAHEINTPIQYVGDNLYFLRTACTDLLAVQKHYEHMLDVTADDVSAAPARARALNARASADVELLSKEIPAACDRALGGVDRVARIVRAMKEFAHPPDREREPADINEALESTLLVAQSEYRHVAQLETNFGELPLVTCSIGELNQAFLNIIVNAAHAIQAAGRELAEGRILVRTCAEKSHVTISINDNGTGIDPSIADKLYDPFFTTKAVGKGTGQGLAIAHAIVVTNHGGNLTFESTPNEGTTFTIRLPVAGPGRAGKSASMELE